MNIKPKEHTKGLLTFLRENEKISKSDCNNILNDATKIVEHCFANNGHTNGLIYGSIQSGKTSIILMVIAIAADHGIRNFIILTSNMNDLYEQTLERTKNALGRFMIIDKQSLKTSLSYNQDAEQAIVITKEPRFLNRVYEHTKEKEWSLKKVFIIDDEADQATLDTNINKPSKSRSTINNIVTELRKLIPQHTYLQTTATPQALLLQDSESPYQPKFAVITRPGKGYIGGDTFFSSENFNESHHIRTTEEIEIEPFTPPGKIANSIAESIITFFMGAAILRLTTGKENNYTYLLHESRKKEDHQRLSEEVNEFHLSITKELTTFVNSSSLSDYFWHAFGRAHADFKKTFGNNLPELAVIIKKMHEFRNSTNVRETNSRTGIGVDANPSSKHILYIGANKLSRGITIKNLIVTYYARETQRPQIDTTLQHARMYGYRQGVLPAIRIYLPLSFASRFFEIHESDNLIRDLVRQYGEPVKLISLKRNLRATRPSVLNKETVTNFAFKSGQKIFPHNPTYEPTSLRKQTKELDELLSHSQYEEKKVYKVPIDVILNILDYRVFQFSEKNTIGFWNDKLVYEAILMFKEIETYQNTAELVVINRAARLFKSKTREYKELASVLPGAHSGSHPFKISGRYPALLMTKITGETKAQGGWAGIPFWIPVVRFPDGNYAFAANFS